MEVRLCSVQTMRVVHYCGIFAYRTRHTQCVACLFLHVACVGSLLTEQGILTGVSISTDGRRNTLATFLIEVGYFFTERRSNLIE